MLGPYMFKHRSHIPLLRPLAQHWNRVYAHIIYKYVCARARKNRFTRKLLFICINIVLKGQD